MCVFNWSLSQLDTWTILLGNRYLESQGMASRESAKFDAGTDQHRHSLLGEILIICLVGNKAQKFIYRSGTSIYKIKMRGVPP